MFQISDDSVIGQQAESLRLSKALNSTFWILQGLLATVFLVDHRETGQPANADCFV